MPEQRAAIPVRYSADPDIMRLYGAPTLSGTELVTPATPLSVGQPARHFRSRVSLAWSQADQGYAVYAGGAGATVTFPGRAPAGLRALDCPEVLTDEPEGTSVLWRAVLGGAEYYWTGAAWAAAVNAAAHWTATAAFQTGLASLPIAQARAGLGFRATLRTTKPGVTPSVYGIRMLWLVRYATTSADAGRQQDQVTELLVALAAWLKTLELEASEEVTSDGATVLSFAGGLGDYARDVTDVVAVYDVTAGPGMDAPLGGTWNGGAKTYTLAAAPTSGHVLHRIYRYRPLVSLGGDRDLVTDALPAVLLRTPRVSSARRAVVMSEHFRGDGTVRLVRPPSLRDLRIPVRVVAEDPGLVRAIGERLQDALQASGVPAQGRLFTLPTAATPVEVLWLGEESPLAESDNIWQHAFALGVYGFPVYLGEGADVPAVDEVDPGAGAPVTV